MANNTTKQTKNTQENIKNVKNTLVAVEKVQRTINALRQKISSIHVEIAKRDEFLATKETVQPATPVVQPVVEVVEQVKETVVEVAPKVETVVEEPKVEQKPVEVTKPQPANENKPAVEEKPAKKESKPVHTEVVSTKENGREVKTYTDEKGNKLVRKFWDPSAQKKPATPQQRPAQQTQGADRKNGGRPDQQRGDRNQQNKPKFDKGENTNNQQRTVAPKKTTSAPSFVAPIPTKQGEQKSFGNKNKTHEKHDEKRTPSKKSLITKNFDNADYDEDKVVRRAKSPKKQEKAVVQAPKITHAVVTTSEVPIKVLSEKIGVSVSEIIKQLFKESIFKTINDSIEPIIRIFFKSVLFGILYFSYA